MQRDGDTVGRQVDPLDQQPQNASLLGRGELIPDRIESEKATMTSASSRSAAQLSRFPGPPTSTSPVPSLVDSSTIGALLRLFLARTANGDTALQSAYDRIFRQRLNERRSP
jgi:hypothetical protein